MPPFVKQLLSGWGNFRPDECRVFRPEKLADLRALMSDGTRDGDNPPAASESTRNDLIARGLGRSYGDSATNAGGGVVLNTRMDCLIGFDPATGVVEAESGVSFATLIDLFLPRGYFLPVTPGTKYVTLGGAIAADVHGKNHHRDGTIGNFVQSLQLLTAAGDVVTCSPDDNADLFWATVGGMGLTGIILSARLKLLPVTSAYLEVAYRRAANLDQAMELLSGGSDRQYSVAWIDCLSAGVSIGRCVLMEADHLPADKLSGRRARQPLKLPARRKRSVPRLFPSFFLGRLAVKAFNKLYYFKHGDGTRIVDLDRYFYPLDAVHHWNRIYGRRGFVQYQALFSTETARAGLGELLARIAESGSASFLAVLKRTGEQGKGMLSFPFPGYTLALDLRNNGKLEALTQSLDAILLKHGGRLYLAKDSTMSPEMFAAMYPRLEAFRAVRQRIDPGNRFSSTQSRRLTI
ncbi:FAD-binding oxidoreductase [Humisphaera borealis]|uniref:FAD-binding oxidoreductase n=1 Tax=Humisphaera borealis TaxID=2807512 RepID=A0A7M2X591_9BACT|nr:FAD-binding oxidoreductase [Humisphaera borealis]QOV91960.1 FAD-binding oxidoreductase [Humisphaera borealis]